MAADSSPAARTYSPLERQTIAFANRLTELGVAGHTAIPAGSRAVAPAIEYQFDLDDPAGQGRLNGMLGLLAEAFRD